MHNAHCIILIGINAYYKNVLRCSNKTMGLQCFLRRYLILVIFSKKARFCRGRVFKNVFSLYKVRVRFV